MPFDPLKPRLRAPHRPHHSGKAPSLSRSSARAGGYAWQGARFLAVALLSAAAVLLMVDWLVFDSRAVLPRLPLGNNDSSPRDKLLLAEQFPDAEVLYLGDSRIGYGVDPEIVSRRCGCGPGFNAAFGGAEPGLTALMAERLLRRLSPTTVVIGLSQWELSDAARVRAATPLRELLDPWSLVRRELEREDPDDVREHALGVWRLYRYRAELRRALDARAGGSAVDPRRGFALYQDGKELSEEDLDQRREQWFDDFEVRGRRSEELRRLLADLRGRGIRVLLVAPPLYPRFRALVRREVAAFAGEAAKLAREHGAAFADAGDAERIGLGEDDFWDAVHLTEPATARFSHYVADAIRTRIAGR